MKYAWIIFSSITFAERLKKACRQKLKHCHVHQTPSAISQSGCSYGIQCYQKDLPDLISLSKSMNLKIKNIYLETGNTSGEVVYKPYDLPR